MVVDIDIHKFDLQKIAILICNKLRNHPYAERIEAQILS
jgi:hypothetical protein